VLVDTYSNRKVQAPNAARGTPQSAAQPSNDPCTLPIPRILIAEDDFEMRRLLSSSLHKDGYEVVEAANGAEMLAELSAGLTYAAPFGFDLIISDIRMPGATGLEALAGLRTCLAPPPVILITAFGDEATHAEAERLGAIALFDKPFEIDQIRAFVRRTLAPGPFPTRASTLCKEFPS
jgi:CheY-like chemotaxis protein